MQLRIAATFDFMCQLSFLQQSRCTAESGPSVSTASYSRLIRHIGLKLDKYRHTRMQACLEKYALYLTLAEAIQSNRRKLLGCMPYLSQ